MKNKDEFLSIQIYKEVEGELVDGEAAAREIIGN